jgi:hypothetical protein
MLKPSFLNLKFQSSWILASRRPWKPVSQCCVVSSCEHTLLPSIAKAPLDTVSSDNVAVKRGLELGSYAGVIIMAPLLPVGLIVGHLYQEQGWFDERNRARKIVTSPLLDDSRLGFPRTASTCSMQVSSIPDMSQYCIASSVCREWSLISTHLNDGILSSCSSCRKRYELAQSQTLHTYFQLQSKQTLQISI